MRSIKKTRQLSLPYSATLQGGGSGEDGNILWTCIHPPNTGWACTHPPNTGWMGWVGGSYRTKNSKCRSFPPALPLHTCTRAWLIIYRRWCSLFTCRWCSLFTHRMQTKIRAFASMRYMLSNFNACVRRVWDGPILFQRLQRFTTSESSTGILWYVTFDIPQCHKGLRGIVNRIT